MSRCGLDIRFLRLAESAQAFAIKSAQNDCKKALCDGSGARRGLVFLRLPPGRSGVFRWHGKIVAL
jgi:hypothetical protein